MSAASKAASSELWTAWLLVALKGFRSAAWTAVLLDSKLAARKVAWTAARTVVLLGLLAESLVAWLGRH